MELWLQQFTEISRAFFYFAWLPLVIWTLLAGTILVALRSAGKLHAQYHYHIRLALIAGLPLGLLSTWGVDQVSALLTAAGAEAASLKVIAVMAPIETGISTQSSTIFPTLTDLFFLTTAVILLLGIVWMMTIRLKQYFQLHLLKKQLPMDRLTDYSFLSKANQDLTGQMRREIRIGFLKQDIIPVTFGVKDPVILVPESLKQTPEKLDLAIRHELTHIQNRDFVTHLLTTAIQSLFWFHPLVHLISRELVDYREMRCDSIIIGDSNISKKQYASLLFELLPMPNLNRQISVNMAQQSSNLKERIERITRQNRSQVLPKRSSLTILATLLVTLTLVMACTDLQTQAVFDEEELDLMTDIDRSGERGYHQVIIYLGDEGQSDRHENAINQLNQLKPEHIKEIEILKGSAATEAFGDRAEHGVILVKTNQDAQSYNRTLQTLGMEPDLSVLNEIQNSDAPDDFFVVVEEMPELIGGLASIQQDIRYPEMARRAGIEGRVYIQFIVNEEGDVENPQVIRGIGGGADEEALRAVQHAKFKPGIQRGRPVRVQYSLPVVFRLQQNENSEDETSE
ncbi:TonB family protein [Rhodohalobacter sp. SW132]|uniref:M56 family metallopeptidase n=1 Tax=Rhodohalobacter sp. SW132 TaxID=2293433 RepID=UPI000E22EDEA|nr:M56 family metallopeptidase [Rhodohalobacter sp. SW132]REL24317.1 TonB family protein [Rhodohalobacter sp. SW132]